MFGNLWILYLFLYFSCAEAHIWAWMLNMPHSPPKEGAKAIRENAPVAKPVTVRYWIQYMNIILLCTKIYFLKFKRMFLYKHMTIESLHKPMSRIFRKLQDFNLDQVWWEPHLFSRLCVNMTGPVDGVSPVIAILVCVCLSEGRATTVEGTPSVSADSAACLGSATAASPMDKRVRVHQQTY